MGPEEAEPLLPERVPTPATLDAFCDAARSLKAAEDAYRAAQQTYAEAVKRLSEEAVR